MAAVLSNFGTAGALWLTFAAATAVARRHDPAGAAGAQRSLSASDHLAEAGSGAPHGFRELAAKPRGSTHMTHEQLGKPSP